MRIRETPLEKGCQAAGILIHDGLKDDTQAAWEVEDTLRQPLSLQTAQTTALVIVHALAQTMPDDPTRLEELIKHWKQSLDPVRGPGSGPSYPWPYGC